MKNLLQETLDELSFHGKSIEDIDWIGSEDYNIPVDFFFKIADVDYDSGYGCQEVACDLMVMFKDGTWLERTEYDGSEWWAYRYPPKKPNEDYMSPFITRGACEEYLDEHGIDAYVQQGGLFDFIEAIDKIKEKAS